MKSDKLHGLELSLTIGCRLDCLYCPQKLLMGRYYGENKNRKSKLSFEDFKIALDKVQPRASISFCGMSEPFHNEACADMIVYAYEKGYKLSLLTTLVGMTENDFEKIKDVTFESFVLHIPDAEKHSKFVIDEAYLTLLQKVNETIAVDYYSCHGSVHDAVKNIIDDKKYAGIGLSNRAGNLDIKRPKEPYKKGKIVCYHGSEAQVGGWMPVMFPDGSLVLCCQDYGMKHVLGNLLTQSWPEICAGEEYQKFVKGLKDDSIDILCRSCADAKKVEALPAIQFKNAVVNHDDLPDENFENIREIVERFSRAETVCVFGLGKLFRDHFFQEYWNEGLNVSVLSDSNPALQGTDVDGIPCIAPAELKKYQNLLVVVFVKNGEAIVSQLESLGIKNCVEIDELYEVCNLISKNKFINMTKIVK